MTIQTAYEVRVQRNANWRVEAIFDDEKLAIAAAERLEQRGQASPVVVLQEIYDAARNHLKSRSIYRSGRAAAACDEPHLSPPAARHGMLPVLAGVALVLVALALIVF